MITVFGLGFVGLTTALGFADKGMRVYGVEIDHSRAALIADGEIPFYEPHLHEALSRNLGKTFFVAEDIAKVIEESRYIFYCVGTPYTGNGSSDLTFLFDAIDKTIEHVKDDIFRVLVIKSTVPPTTTTERVLPYIKGKAINAGLANNPEFLREGYCWEDFVYADRIVLGCNDELCKDMLIEIYKPFNTPIVVVNHNTGEFIKYLSNTLLATMISFSNEVSVMADYFGGIDVKSAFKILHMDKRWGDAGMKAYVYPGCGYGGYCLPKDTKALLRQSEEKGFSPRILSEVININERMPERIVDRIEKAAQKNERIGILGLSFKPCSDDVRETSAAKIIAELLKRGFDNIIAHDPIAIENFKMHYNLKINYCADLEKLNADIFVITTAWEEYKNIKGRVIDCRYFI